MFTVSQAITGEEGSEAARPNSDASLYTVYKFNYLEDHVGLIRRYRCQYVVTVRSYPMTGIEAFS